MSKTIDDILRSAEQHDIDSEPDHEVGDLQNALRIAWEEMTSEQRKRLASRYFTEVHDQERQEECPACGGRKDAGAAYCGSCTMLGARTPGVDDLPL
jgi:hypothetical protein